MKLPAPTFALTVVPLIVTNSGVLLDLRVAAPTPSVYEPTLL